MPVYGYKCEAGHRIEVDHPREYSNRLTGKACGVKDCIWALRRDYQGIQFAKVMQESFSPSTGRTVSDPKKFKSQLREASDKATERTGILHDFQPADPAELLRQADDHG